MSVNNNKYIFPVIESAVLDLDRTVLTSVIQPLAKGLIYTNLKTNNSANAQNSANSINDADGTSMFGTPIFDTVTLSYTNPSYNGSNSNILGTNLDLSVKFNICMTTVNQARNIVRTKINGQNGTIKEFISDDDLILTCEAILSFDGINYLDYSTIASVSNIFKVQDTLQITSSIINRSFYIYNVVVNDFTFQQMEPGMRNVQKFSFSLMSDTPQNYNIIFP